MINIITRTSKRPNGYRQNRDMLIKNGLNLSIPFSQVNHIIITDDIESIDYIDSDYILMNKKNSPDTKKPIESFIWRPYNTYFNKVKHLLKEGWIMYIDDDDRLYNESILSKLIDITSNYNEDTLIFFQMEYADGKRLPQDNWDGIPKLNQIGGSCLIFHTKWYEHAIWDEWSASDYRVIKKLYDILPNKVFIKEPMVYINQIGGGKQTDL